MGFGNRLWRLWNLRTGVAVSFAIALLCALWSVYKISLVPPGLTARSMEMATASTHVLVDTPRSTLVDRRQDTYSLESLTQRAIVLGNVIANGPVRESITQRAGIPSEALQVTAPLTRQQPQVRPEPGKEPSATEILESTDQYRLNIQANPTVPLLDIYAQTPSARSSELLANAAADELKKYLAGLASSRGTPENSQIRLMQLGRARGAVINGGVRWQAAIATFLLTFAASCATVIFLSRVRKGWREAAKTERLEEDWLELPEEKPLAQRW